MTGVRVDIHGLDKVFKPQRIVLFGANENPRSVGCTLLRNLVGSGFRGVVYPVHPTLESVQGIHCYRNVADLPRRADLAIVCTAAAAVPGIVRACGDQGILGLVIISAGFREVGEDGVALENLIRQEARRYDGMRIVGPNCLGVIVPGIGLNASFALGSPRKGNVAFISQSGALCTSVLDWAADENIGFSYFVSVGNMIDVDYADIIDYLDEDEDTRAIVLYVESLRDARKFMTAARAFARRKPVVAYKAGRFAESAKAAASHTGALAGEDAVYEAAFERSGIVRVYEIGDIFDCVDLLGRYQPPRGARLAIVTNAGGPGVMATDALIARQGALAELTPATIEALNESLPPFWSHGNPVDVLGDARPKRFARATEIVLADPNVDAALVILTPQAMTSMTGTAKAIGELATHTGKPILAAWLGGASVREGVSLLNQAGIATYPTPEQAVNAFMTLVAYARNLEILFETPRDIQIEFPPERKASRALLAAAAPEGKEQPILDEGRSKRLLAAYGIPVVEAFPASDRNEAADAASRAGFPAVLKILSPDITHKTDVGGVALDLANEAAVREAFDRVVGNARRHRPDARILGVTVQRMARREEGFELILGSKKDATFGAILLAGSGGIGAEIFRDRALGLPPLNERLARRMLESLAAWPLLQGYRGRPGANIDALVETMIRFSYLVADHPEIRELDVNPLLVTPREVVALDARVLVDPALVGRMENHFEHLALRPYPEEYVSTARLKDGTEVLLRPIKPEDEPLWMGLLSRCSPETIFSRFRSAFPWNLHETATRFCFIDYDREIGIVAEVEERGARSLAGVGRLVADPDHETVEYAVLVADTWQNRGLGGVLTDRCVEIARHWGLQRIVAETTPENQRMLALFENRGFSLRRNPGWDVVEVVKDLPLRR